MMEQIYEIDELKYEVLTEERTLTATRPLLIIKNLPGLFHTTNWCHLQQHARSAWKQLVFQTTAIHMF